MDIAGSWDQEGGNDVLYHIKSDKPGKNSELRTRLADAKLRTAQSSLDQVSGKIYMGKMHADSIFNQYDQSKDC